MGIEVFCCCWLVELLQEVALFFTAAQKKGSKMALKRDLFCYFVYKFVSIDQHVDKMDKCLQNTSSLPNNFSLIYGVNGKVKRQVTYVYKDELSYGIECSLMVRQGLGESGPLNSIPSSSPDLLCDVEQVTQPLHVSLTSCIMLIRISTPLHL